MSFNIPIIQSMYPPMDKYILNRIMIPGNCSIVEKMYMWSSLKLIVIAVWNSMPAYVHNKKYQ